MAAPDIVTKRIHVGGLTPSITPAHIKDRFKSFGNVLDVEDLKADALGQPRPFTFFTIQTTPSQLVKCLNIMSGSMWRGCQLRLAEAKPKYDVRLAKERNPTKESIDERLRKRKRRAVTVRAADVGKEAQDMRLPSEENYKTKKFWTVDADGHLIRPVTLRPTHPLPRPAVFITKPDAKKRRNPPTKLNMRIINPALWNPTHLTESSLETADTEIEVEREGWEFESASEDEEDDEGKVLTGRWLKSTDAGIEAEEVWVTGRAVPDHIEVVEDVPMAGAGRAQGSRSVSPLFAGRKDRSASLLFPTQRAEGSASPLFVSRRPIEAVEESAPGEDASEDDFPLFATTAPSAAAASRSASPLFAGRAAQRTVKPVVSVTPEVNASEDDFPLFKTAAPPAAVASRSASPLFAGRVAQQTVESAVYVASEEDASEDECTILPTSAEPAAPPSRSISPLFSNRRPVTKEAKAPPPPSKKLIETITQENTVPDPIRDAAKAERSRDLGLLASFLGEKVSTAAKPTRGEWAGFDEDEDDDEDYLQPLRIRGGAGDEEEEEESSSEDSDDSSSESSDSDSDSDSSASSDGVDVELGTPHPSKPVVPATSVTPAEAPTPVPKPKTQSVLKAMFAPAPATSSFSLLGALDADIELDEELDIPLAPPPIKHVYEPAAALQPLSVSKKSHFDPDPSIPLFFPSFGKGGKDAMKEDTDKEGYVGFWKQETDEEMKEIWENDKVELTRDWKKRYRDGKKQRKRRGGGNDVE